MGDAFMRGYYSIHDMDNKRMGFVPFPGSAKGVPVARRDPPHRILPLAPMVFPIRGMYIFGYIGWIWLVLAALVGSIGYGIWVCCLSKLAFFQPD